MVNVYDVQVVRSIVAQVHIFVVVSSSNLHEVICNSLVVAAIWVTIRMRVNGTLGLALSVEIIELSVVASMRLAATLGYSQATNDSIVLREVSPLVMRQKVPNLIERKKDKI